MIVLHLFKFRENMIQQQYVNKNSKHSGIQGGRGKDTVVYKVTIIFLLYTLWYYVFTAIFIMDMKREYKSTFQHLSASSLITIFVKIGVCIVYYFQNISILFLFYYFKTDIIKLCVLSYSVEVKNLIYITFLM